MLLLSLLILFNVGCASSDPWTKSDTYRQAVVTAALIGDAVTTAKIRECNNCYENGPLTSKILGRQPNVKDTYTYYGTLIISNYFISRALPAKWRPYWQTWEFSVHTYSISKNCSIGLC